MNKLNQILSWRPRRTKRRAAIAATSALTALSSCLLCGLVVDVGNVCVSKAELSRCSDAASLAASAVMLDQDDLNGQPNPALVAYKARNAAVEYVGLNPCRNVTLALPRNDANTPSGDIVLGRYNSETDEFDTNGTKHNSARVVARRDTTVNGPIPLYFGGLVGIPSVSGNGKSAAFIEKDISGFGIKPGTGVTCKLLPFSLQIDLWLERLSERNDDYTHDTVNHTVSNGPDGIYEVNIYPGKITPGNFGTVDIGNPNNSTSDLARQILYGPNAYDFSFFPDSTVKLDENGILILNGDTGVSAGMKDELAAIKGQPRIMPLHATVSGNGNNAQFQVVAFVGVTIVDVDLTGALNSKYVILQPCYTCDDTSIGGGNDGVSSEFLYKPPRLRKVK